MPRIDVGRYQHPESTGFKGWLEPETGDWIVFVRNDGAVLTYWREKSGAVIGDPAILT